MILCDTSPVAAGQSDRRYAHGVLPSPAELLDRLRHGRSRAGELARLRVRFRAVSVLDHGGSQATRLAVELRELRERTCLALRHATSCARCARGHQMPAGRWEGGHCCGGQTLELFSQDELAALWLAGTRLRHLTPPATDHAGCAFRGSTGCSLAPRHRPTICVRYVCLELRQELREGGDWPTVAPLAQRMNRLFGELSALRKADDWLPPSGSGSLFRPG